MACTLACADRCQESSLAHAVSSQPQHAHLTPEAAAHRKDEGAGKGRSTQGLAKGYPFPPAPGLRPGIVLSLADRILSSGYSIGQVRGIGRGGGAGG